MSLWCFFFNSPSLRLVELAATSLNRAGSQETGETQIHTISLRGVIPHAVENHHASDTGRQTDTQNTDLVPEVSSMHGDTQ